MPKPIQNINTIRHGTLFASSRHGAGLNQNVEMTKLLLAYGAKISAAISRGRERKFLFFLASRFGPLRSAVTLFVLEMGQ